jgi:hypothetical protein
MSDKIVTLGLGEAVQRLIRVEVAHAMGLRVREDALAEARMLRETMDQYDLQVAFDCNIDGVPDTVDIYQQAADTSCCRIVSVPTRRVATEAPRRTRGSSRSRK